MAVFFVLFSWVNEGLVVALQVAKDYNIGQRYFAGVSSVASGFVFSWFSLKNTDHLDERLSSHGNVERFLNGAT